MTVGKPRVHTPPDPHSHMLWCPLCELPDVWHMTDTMANRKRLGQHIADRHDGVRLPHGLKPEDVE